jgi:hypothetical protein
MLGRSRGQADTPDAEFEGLPHVFNHNCGIFFGSLFVQAPIFSPVAHNRLLRTGSDCK